MVCHWPGSGGGGGRGWCGGGTAGGGGLRVGTVLSGSLGVPPDRVGVACVCRAVFAFPGWPPCRGGRWWPWHPAGAVVRRQRVAAGRWCSLAWVADGGAAGGGGVLVVGHGAVGACARRPAGLRGRMVAQMSRALAVGAAGGAGLCGGGHEGVSAVRGTTAPEGTVVQGGVGGGCLWCM